MSSTVTKTPGDLAAASKLSVLSNQIYLKSSSLLQTVGKKYYDNHQYNYRLIIQTAFVGLTLLTTAVFVFSQIRGISSKYCECSNLSQTQGTQGRIINGEDVDWDELRWVAGLLVRRKIARSSYR